MRTINSERSRTSRIYIHSHAQKALFDYAQELQLPDGVFGQCKKFMRELWKFIPNTREVPQTALAIIYLLTRKTPAQIPLKEFKRLLQQNDASKKSSDLLKTVGQLGVFLGIKTKLVTPEEYLAYLIRKLQKSDTIPTRFHNAKFWINFYVEWLTFYAFQFVKYITPVIRTGKNPLNLAAAILCGADYLIGLDNDKNRGFITQRGISEATELKEYSVSELYRKIVKPILQSQDFESAFQKWEF